MACAAAEDGASTPTSPGTASRGVSLPHTGGGDGGGGDGGGGDGRDEARRRRAATTHARVRSATTGGGGDGGYVDVSDPKSEESVEFVPADDDSDGELRFPRVAADSATFGPAEARRAKLKRFLPLVAVFALVALVVLLSALLSTASQAVERGEWALRVGRHNGKLDRRGNFGPGLYWWGPKWRALTLPSTVVPRGFTHQRVLVRSGQNISIDFVVYTRYIRDELPTLLMTTGTDPASRIEAMLVGAVKNAAPRYALTDYIARRDVVSTGFRDAAAAAMVEARLPVNVTAFFLGLPVLPEQFRAQRRRIFYAATNRTAMEFQRRARAVRLGTSVNVSRLNASRAFVLENASLTAGRIVGAAGAEASARLRQTAGWWVAHVAAAIGGLTAAQTADLAKFNLLLDRAEAIAARQVGPAPVATNVTGANATAVGRRWGAAAVDTTSTTYRDAVLDAALTLVSNDAALPAWHGPVPFFAPPNFRRRAPTVANGTAGNESTWRPPTAPLRPAGNATASCPEAGAWLTPGARPDVAVADIRNATLALRDANLTANATFSDPCMCRGVGVANSTFDCWWFVWNATHADANAGSNATRNATRKRREMSTSERPRFKFRIIASLWFLAYCGYAAGGPASWKLFDIEGGRTFNFTSAFRSTSPRRSQCRA